VAVISSERDSDFRWTAILSKVMTATINEMLYDWSPKKRIYKDHTRRRSIVQELLVDAVRMKLWLYTDVTDKVTLCPDCGEEISKNLDQNNYD
jgi:hypothetical protein